MNIIVFCTRLLASIFIWFFTVGAFLHDAFYAGLLSFVVWAIDALPLLSIIRGRTRILPLSSFKAHINIRSILTFLRWLLGIVFCLAAVSDLTLKGFMPETVTTMFIGLFLISPLGGIVFEQNVTPATSQKKASHDIKILIVFARNLGFWCAMCAVAFYNDNNISLKQGNIFLLISLPLLFAGPVLALIKGRKLSNTTGVPVVEPNVFQPAIPEKEVSADMGKLREAFMELINMEPQKRGYAFQDFLNTLFTVFNFSAKSAFRLTGEEIDGSFELDSQTYLLEAKWQARQCGQAHLLTFNGKVEGKSTWARGIFISYSGFTSDGLEAFSRGKRTSIIGMDGQDLLCILEGKISLVNAIKRKARRAVETNDFFVPLFELI